MVHLCLGWEEEAVREERKKKEAHIGSRLCPGTMARERSTCHLRDFFWGSVVLAVLGNHLKAGGP